MHISHHIKHVKHECVHHCAHYFIEGNMISYTRDKSINTSKCVDAFIYAILYVCMMCVYACVCTWSHYFAFDDKILLDYLLCIENANKCVTLK